MSLEHVVKKRLRRLTTRFPSLHRISIISIALTLAWLYTLHRGERSVYRSHIEACHWDRWEEWPEEATPHRLVFIADPQLVDPHTYPGRPWPLSYLTEVYTDLYMHRNYRLVNEHLDPDSIIFLGDLFDGGREWAPDKARELNDQQREHLEKIGVLKPKEQKHQKRDLESYKGAVDKGHLNVLSKQEKDPEIELDMKTFIPGENGRWSKWGGKQWEKDFDRFSRIFFAPEQLYPERQRQLFAAYRVDADPISIENGAKVDTWQEYATSGGKSRHVIASLPGNHDVGFGARVQVVVRNRFESRFGNGNRIDILGNHTFISVDTPSMSAHSQFMSDGFEHEPKDLKLTKHIWKPSMDFVNNLRHPVGKAVQEALSQYYPKGHTKFVWNHEVTEPGDRKNHPSPDKLALEAAYAPKPKLPVILLSHVPLYRNPDTDCGPLRERGGALTLQYGYQYQNVLTQSLSRDIIGKVLSAGDIAAIFSGDDHDYCDVPHRYNVAAAHSTNPMETQRTKMATIREITVKSFSWAMGVRRPGFELISLWNPVDAQGNTIGTPLPTIQTHLCLLPDQLSIFIDYALLFLLTLPLLLVRAIYMTLRDHGRENKEERSFSFPMNGIPRSQASGTPSPSEKPKSKTRQRGASTSTSSHSSTHNGYLGVQRSFNARTRSVSPNYGAGSGSQQSTGTLIDKAGYFPQVRWTDPSDADSDEESNIGSDVGWTDDSQAKWKWRRRSPGRVRKALDEFGRSLLFVGVPGALWYVYLFRNG